MIAKAFYLEGRLLLTYSLSGSYAGEEEETKELLAYLHGVDKDMIKTNIIWKEDENEIDNG